MDTGLDTRLHDDVALAEIDLYTDVLIAAGEADAPLTLEELDQVLGLLPPSPEPAPPPRAPHREKAPVPWRFPR
ncbi:hypothetical protein [Actinorugispora endophytica]|uniref:Uncharacterized protein n=1 Tax=Actinorugispora endophytica TaxID=1605990 RepID=A0A4R6V8Z2_9ACTN|nr:hypothetical protein [Actinorugispora endophytica]TDQ55258.1 hypothetical protein EV190_101583 [Actinorugispora endophytica]